jgi:hypothetical protein
VYAGHHASSLVVTKKRAQPNSRHYNYIYPIESEALASKLNVGVFLSTMLIRIMMKIISGLRMKLDTLFT